MKKYEIVRKKDYFNAIIQNNKQYKTKYFVAYIMKKESSSPKFGIAVGKKIGNAVVRNKLKRQYRVIIDKNKFMFPKYNDYIIMIKKASLIASFNEMNKSMQNLLNERVIK